MARRFLYYVCNLPLSVCRVILVDTFGIADSDIYLVHDDLDKVLGKCVIKEGGSARYKLWILQVPSSFPLDFPIM